MLTSAVFSLGEKCNEGTSSWNVSWRLFEVAESRAGRMSASFSFRPLFLPCFTFAKDDVREGSIYFVVAEHVMGQGPQGQHLNLSQLTLTLDEVTVSVPRTSGCCCCCLGKYFSSASLSSRTISVMKSSGPYDFEVASMGSPCLLTCLYREGSRMGSPFESWLTSQMEHAELPSFRLSDLRFTTWVILNSTSLYKLCLRS